MQRAEKAIKDFANETIAKEVHRYGKAGKKAIEKIHYDIIDEWFGDYDSASMKNTITSKYESRGYEDGGVRIYVYAYTDSSRYNQNQKIQQWNKRNNIGLGHDTLVEYVMSLQLFEGIIGLPKDGMREIPEGTPIRSNGHLDENRRWVNDNFIQKEPLMGYIRNHASWNNWESMVKKFL